MPLFRVDPLCHSRCQNSATALVLNLSFVPLTDRVYCRRLNASDSLSARLRQREEQNLCRLFFGVNVCPQTSLAHVAPVLAVIDTSRSLFDHDLRYNDKTHVSNTD